MRRISVVISEEMDKKILELRKTDEFIRCTYSEIVRKILERGFSADFEYEYKKN